MKTAAEIMRHSDDSVPEYMTWLQKADFSYCPEVTFIYGSDETLYACEPSFKTAMKKYGVKYEMIVGEGMFHCYPVFPICREYSSGQDIWQHIRRNMLIMIERYTKDLGINKKTGDLYAPIYKRAMKADQKIYDFMYERIPEIFKNKEILEIAAGPGAVKENPAPENQRELFHNCPSAAF